MKNLVFLSFISTLYLYAATPTAPIEIPITPQPNHDKELAWVDEQVSAIIPARVGIHDGFINSLRDPMKLKKPVVGSLSGSKLLAPPKLEGSAGVLAPPKVIEEPLRLSAVMNQSVLINGKWYKAGENVRNMTVSEIKPNSVLLTGKKDQKLMLFLTKQHDNIKIITK